MDTGRITRKIIAAFVLIAVFVSILAGEMLAQTEKEVIEEATVKIKSGKLEEADFILKEGQKNHPSSVGIARLRIIVCEKMKAESDRFAEAYEMLVKALKMKEVVDGKLSGRDASLLRKSKKKLSELMKIRWGVDKAAEGYIVSVNNICEKFLRQGRSVEASFVFLKIIAVAGDKKEMNEKTEALSKKIGEKARLLKKPEIGFFKVKDKAHSLLSEARRLLRKGKVGEARITCRAALEVDYNAAEAYSLLCEIAEKEKQTEEILTQGLTYLLFPVQAQSCVNAEETIKRVSKASGGLKEYFKKSKAAQEEVCKLAEEAVRKKKKSDLEYALLALSEMTHRSRRVEAALSKAESLLGGFLPWQRIFDGSDMSAWQSVTGLNGSARGGCIEVLQNEKATSRAIWTGVQTSGSFKFQFSFQLERTGDKAPSAAADVPRSTLYLTLWAQKAPYGGTDSIYIALNNDATSNGARMFRPRATAGQADMLTETVSSGPSWVPGKWYVMRVEYEHDKPGKGKIKIALDGRNAVTIPVPAKASPSRAGYVGIGQQLFKSVKFKDIFLIP